VILHVKQAEYRGSYTIWLRFTDGTCGLADLAGHLNGSMFEPLRDKRAFKRLRVDAAIGTVVWPNGADLAPEFLRDLALRTGEKRKSAPIRPRARKRSHPRSAVFRTESKELAR
jgi:hypothetical protein